MAVGENLYMTIVTGEVGHRYGSLVQAVSFNNVFSCKSIHLWGLHAYVTNLYQDTNLNRDELPLPRITIASPMAERSEA